MPLNKEYEKHESYAMVGIGRRNGRNDDLFGSSIEVDNVIAITIRRGAVARDLSTYWYHGHEELIEVELSPNQFAELLTTMNVGDGVPCTLRSFNGKRVAKGPSVNREEEVKNKFRADCQKMTREMSECVTEARQVLAQKDIKKADKERLNSLINQIEQHMSSNLPFVMDCFDEQMDKTVAEAKAEVDAMFLHTIHKFGTERLQQELAAGNNPVQARLTE